MGHAPRAFSPQGRVWARGHREFANRSRSIIPKDVGSQRGTAAPGCILPFTEWLVRVALVPSKSQQAMTAMPILSIRSQLAAAGVLALLERSRNANDEVGYYECLRGQPSSTPPHPGQSLREAQADRTATCSTPRRT